jgi:hypothetical protein
MQGTLFLLADTTIFYIGFERRKHAETHVARIAIAIASGSPRLSWRVEYSDATKKCV